MPRTWTSSRTIPLLALIAFGATLGVLHARAFGVGGRSPGLSFDAAQYALAARTLAERGTLATWFALPIDLVDIKVCAVDADWSGLKLTRRRA